MDFITPIEMHLQVDPLAFKGMNSPNDVMHVLSSERKLDDLLGMTSREVLHDVSNPAYRIRYQ